MPVIFSSVLTEITVALATCLVAVYVYFSLAYQYWKRRGVHYEKPTMFIGNLGKLILQRASLGQCLRDVYKNNPGHPVVGIYAMKTPVLVVRDVDLLRNVLVKDAHYFLDRSLSFTSDSDSLIPKALSQLKGKKWKHMRVKLTPTFTSGKIKNMFPLINACSKDLVQCIGKEITSKGNSIVVKDTVARYSTDVIASCAFGVNANALTDPNSEFRTVTRKMFEPSGLQKIAAVMVTFTPWLSRLLGVTSFDSSVDNYIRKTFWDVVDYRKKNNVVRKDFVHILMQLKNEGEVRAEDKVDLQEIKNDSKYMNMENIKTDKIDIKLEDDDFVAQAAIFIGAGYETSSSVISFTLFELALNPNIQDNLRREIKAVLNKHNSEVTYEAISEMNYLDMVVSEAVRKYPTVPTLNRQCLQDYKIPGTDIIVEKGTTVMIPVLGIHWDPDIYPEPQKFDPERFSPENKTKRSNFAHLPFGEGPRICIGMRFGQMQVKTALVHILSSYQVRPCAETPPSPLEMLPNAGVSLPKKSLVLAFHKIT